MKIALLGCGWLGIPVAKKLINEGHSVIGTTTSKDKLAKLNALGIYAELFSLEDETYSIPQVLSAEILIINIPSKNEEAFAKVDKLITHSSIKKVIFVSSTSVYHNDIGLYYENSEDKSNTLVRIENIFKHNLHFATTIIRFAGMFGYDRKPSNFFKKNDYKIPNPQGKVNMIHQDDCVQIIHEIIKQEAWDKTYNACASSHPSRKVFYTNAAIAAGKEIPTFIDTDIVEGKIISNDKLLRELQIEFINPDLDMY